MDDFSAYSIDQKAVIFADAVYDVGHLLSSADQKIYPYYDGSIDRFFVAFDGTNNAKDVLTDANAIPNFRGCHSGFYNRFKAIEKEVIEHLGELNFDLSKTTWVGHSMGGDIALNFAKKYKGDAITFGAAKNYLRFNNPKIPHRRFYDSRDPVPMFMVFLYQHYGEEINIGESGFVNDDYHKIDHYKSALGV